MHLSFYHFTLLSVGVASFLLGVWVDKKLTNNNKDLDEHGQLHRLLAKPDRSGNVKETLVDILENLAALQLSVNDISTKVDDISTTCATTSDVTGLDCASVDDLLDVVPTGPRTVFITSESFWGGEFGGLAGADTICQNLANTAGLDGIFKAWLSDSSPGGSVAERFTKHGSFSRTDGYVIADNWDDLTDGALVYPGIVFDENRAGPSTTDTIWTGTQSNGVATGDDCDGWTRPASRGTIGIAGSADATGWTNSDPLACTQIGRLYCFQQ